MLLAILFGIGFSFAMTMSTQWHLRFPVLNRKPFNCGSCLAGWAATVAYFIPENYTAPFTVFLAANMIYYLIHVK